jgi:hypothetical protein
MKRALRAPFVAVGLVVVAVLTARPVLAASGFLDPTFSGDGVVRLGPPETGLASVDRADVRVGPGGRAFVIEGLRNTDGESNAGFLRVRSASGGVLSSYVGNGTIKVGSAAEGFVRSLGMFPLAGGGIVYGVVKDDIGEPTEFVAQRSPDGHLVTSAGIPGVIADVETYISPLTRLPGGSIRGCARFVSEIRLVGLTPELTPDSRLGPSNYTVLAVPSCVTSASDPAGRTYVLGITTVSGEGAIEVFAYDANGALITTWGTAGHQTIALAGSDVRLGKGQIVAAADGSMMIPGEVQSTLAGSKPAAAILSLGAGGVPNATFSGDGIATFSPFGGRSSLWAMDLDSSGRPIVSIVSWLDDGHVRAVLARIATSGAIDATFGHDGFVTLKRATRDLDVDTMNRIVSVAIDGNVVILTRRT